MPVLFLLIIVDILEHSDDCVHAVFGISNQFESKAQNSANLQSIRQTKAHYDRVIEIVERSRKNSEISCTTNNDHSKSLCELTYPSVCVVIILLRNYITMLKIKVSQEILIFFVKSPDDDGSVYCFLKVRNQRCSSDCFYSFHFPRSNQEVVNDIDIDNQADECNR